LQSETTGFTHVTPRTILTHLHDTGAALDFMDVMELTTALQKPWDHAKALSTLFVRQDKIERQLELAGVPVPPNI
jgi:hypothetical protein